MVTLNDDQNDGEGHVNTNTRRWRTQGNTPHGRQRPHAQHNNAHKNKRERNHTRRKCAEARAGLTGCRLPENPETERRCPQPLYAKQHTHTNTQHAVRRETEKRRPVGCGCSDGLKSLPSLCCTRKHCCGNVGCVSVRRSERHCGARGIPADPCASSQTTAQHGPPRRTPLTRRRARRASVQH